MVPTRRNVERAIIIPGSRVIHAGESKLRAMVFSESHFYRWKSNDEFESSYTGSGFGYAYVACHQGNPKECPFHDVDNQ